MQLASLSTTVYHYYYYYLVTTFVSSFQTADCISASVSYRLSEMLNFVAATSIATASKSLSVLG